MPAEDPVALRMSFLQPPSPNTAAAKIPMARPVVRRFISLLTSDGRALQVTRDVGSMADIDVRAPLRTGDALAKAGDIRGANDCHMRAAEAFAERGFPLKAAAVFKQVLTLDPARVDLHPKLAAAYAALGLHADAAAELEKLAVEISSKKKG